MAYSSISLCAADLSETMFSDEHQDWILLAAVFDVYSYRSNLTEFLFSASVEFCHL
jgi:hypothetical protein